jgi:photosystem II stability/assembly factor-like uncharacterized protein
VGRCAVAALLVVLTAGCGGSRSQRLFKSVRVTKVTAGSEAKVKPRPFAASSLVFSTNKHGLLGTFKNGETLKGRELLETRDGGRSWSVATTRAPTQPGQKKPATLPCLGEAPFPQVVTSFWSEHGGYAVCALEPSAGLQWKTLYETGDGGRTWRKRASHKQLPIYGYLNGLHFFDRAHGLLLTERGGIYVTADGGLSWWQSFYNPSESTIYWSFPDPRDIYAAASSDGVYVSHDLGRTWERVWPALSPIGPISYSSASDAIGAVAPSGPDGLDGTAILHSGDGGRSWQLWGRIHVGGAAGAWRRTWGAVYTYTGSVVWQLVRLSPRSVIGLVSGPNDVGPMSFFRSDDNGRNWRKLATLNAGNYVDASSISVSFSGRDGFLLDPYSGRLFTTHDSGASWKLTGRHPSFSSVTAIGGKQVLAIAKNIPFMYASDDAGASWRRVLLSVLSAGAAPQQIAVVGPRHIWIVAGGAFIVRTNDAGRSWSAFKFPEGFSASAITFVSPDTGFAEPGDEVSPGNLLGNACQPSLVTRDGGKTWNPLPVGPSLVR